MNSNKTEIIDFIAILAQEYGEVASATREKAIEEAWEDYKAQILLDARKNARLSQAQLTERIGADKAYVSRVERGVIVPSIAMFYKIAAAMGLSVELRPA
jgi:ribosome-binding protein aMBF1 (putative translation factor)